MIRPSAPTAELLIPCHSCHHTFTCSFPRLQEGTPLTCPSCDAQFRLTSDHLTFALEKADKEVRQAVLAWALKVGMQL